MTKDGMMPILCTSGIIPMSFPSQCKMILYRLLVGRVRGHQGESRSIYASKDSNSCSISCSIMPTQVTNQKQAQTGSNTQTMLKKTIYSGGAPISAMLLITNRLWVHWRTKFSHFYYKQSCNISLGVMVIRSMEALGALTLWTMLQKQWEWTMLQNNGGGGKTMLQNNGDTQCFKKDKGRQWAGYQAGFVHHSRLPDKDTWQIPLHPF